MPEVIAPDPDVAPAEPTPPIVNVSFVDSLKSRKLIIAVLSSTLVFVNYYFKLGLSNDQLQAVLTPLLGWIAIEGVADVVTRAKQD